MALRYRNDVIPSKRAALFYAAYFAVLGVVLLLSCALFVAWLPVAPRLPGQGDPGGSDRAAQGGPPGSKMQEPVGH